MELRQCEERKRLVFDMVTSLRRLNAAFVFQYRLQEAMLDLEQAQRELAQQRKEFEAAKDRLRGHVEGCGCEGPAPLMEKRAG